MSKTMNRLLDVLASFGGLTLTLAVAGAFAQVAA